MTQQQTISARAWAELFLLAMIWGGSFLSIRVALDQVGVLTTVAFRVLGALLVLGVYVLARRLPLPRDPKIWLAFLVLGLLNNAIPFTLITWGEVRIPSGLASILNAATAILGVLVASLVFADERLSARKLTGVALGFLGVITAIGLGVLEAFDLHSLSQLAVLGAATSYACAAAFARATMKGLKPQVVSAGMLLGSALIMVPLALWQEGWPTFHYIWPVWGAVLYLAVVATAGAYLLFYRVIAMAGAGNASLVTLLVAPIAIVLGALVLGEALPPRAYAGFALLALGLLVIDGRLLRRLWAPAEKSA
ncbi:MAG: EamA family transporter [Rhodobacteraceae bacterium]|nr:EamA family transporter [Paracoccaceae bacterium]